MFYLEGTLNPKWASEEKSKRFDTQGQRDGQAKAEAETEAVPWGTPGNQKQQGRSLLPSFQMKFGPEIWISDFWTVSENISPSLSHKTCGKLLQKSREMRKGITTVSRQKMLKQKW